MTGRILITPRSLSQSRHPALQPLKDAGFELMMPSPGMMPGEAELMAALPGCVGWLAGVERITENTIAAANTLRVISRNGTGVDNLPMDILKARGILVLRAEGANARGVAELALTLALAGLRHLIPTHEGIKQGNWPRRIGREMASTRVGVVGLGAIGSTFTELCLALGASVRGFDPFAPGNRLRHPRFLRTDLVEVFEQADIVSLHAPMPADGKAIIGAGLLARMTKGAVLVNTARANLVDRIALLAALNKGQIITYATDVFDPEPPEPSALLMHPGIVLTSHIGGFTTESVERATSYAVSNLLKALSGDAY